MTGRANITFTQPGVQAPVYVVTSLSSPPWVPLELSVSDEKTPSGDLIFARAFEDVAEGSYQYKIRIGEGHWVVDESKDSATDGSGNRNNVINVAPDVKPPSAVSSVVRTKDRQDSVQGPTSNNQASIPTPFVVVETVADKDPPDYGGIETNPLHEDATKRTADAEPDFESALPESPVKTHQKESNVPLIPIVIVEKTDDSPVHGDDFGKDATSAQKLARELRAADASPDEVIVSPDPEEQTAPLFRHETVASGSNSHVDQDVPLVHHVAGQPTLPGTTAADPIPPVVGPDPLSQEQDVPLFRHEAPLPEADTVGVIEEESTQSSTDQESSHADVHTPSDISDEGEVQYKAINKSVDEPDNGPLLPHETGFSKPEGTAIQPEVGEESDASDDGNYGAEYEAECPLLPHERNSNDPSPVHPEVVESTYPGRTDVFVRRNSSLPHVIPPSDEEDDDLRDPSLEEFPTEKRLIFERVASISSQLPADETRDFPHSPEFAVVSQACSSVDLAPSTSHTSLRPVVEEALLESESENDDELYISHAQSKGSADSAGMTDANDQKAAKSIQTGDATSHSQSVSEAESVQKVDGAKEDSVDPASVYDAIATPAKILNPLTPPLTPERTVSKPLRISADSDSTPKISQDTEESSLKPLADVSTASASPQDPRPAKGGRLLSIAHFLTSCFGGKKQAR